MLLNPDAFVQAEIDRRLELTGAYQWNRPLRARREWPRLRNLFGRGHLSLPRAAVLR